MKPFFFFFDGSRLWLRRDLSITARILVYIYVIVYRTHLTIVERGKLWRWRKTDHGLVSGPEGMPVGKAPATCR